MLRVRAIVVAGVLLAALPVKADHEQLSTTDPALGEELLRQRLQSEYLLLERARLTPFGPAAGTEGRLFTLRLALLDVQLQQPVTSAAPRLQVTWGGVERQPAHLPPFRLAWGQEQSVLHSQVGAIDVTLGQGALMRHYTNNPRAGLDVGLMGVVLGVNLSGVGGTVMTGNLLEPGRLVGAHVHVRPLMLLGGNVGNTLPDAWRLLDLGTVLLSSVSLGVTGVLDSELPGTFFRGLRGPTEWRLPARVPGTAGGLSGEADVGITYGPLDFRVFGNASMLGRSFQTEAAQAASHLWGAGASAGVRTSISAPFLRVGGAAQYDLSGPDYLPAYFDRHHEEHRLAMDNGAPKITLRNPASHGYRLELGAQLFDALGAFWEWVDSFALDGSLDGHRTEMRLGTVLHVLGVLDLMGAYVNRGFHDYRDAFVPDVTSLWLAEARLQVLAFSLVARGWRGYHAQIERGPTPISGSSVLAEIRLRL
ncbi:MAG: hypothetical protein AB2A00_31295 [Myxococcota bacterium]